MRPSFAFLASLCFALLVSTAPIPDRSDLAIRNTDLNARNLIPPRAPVANAAEDTNIQRREASPDTEGGPPDWHQPRAVNEMRPPSRRQQ